MAVSAMFGPTGETPVPRSKADTYFSNDAYWLNSADKREAPEVFRNQVHMVCECYQHAHWSRSKPN